MQAMNGKVKRGVSKAQWIEEALKTLAAGNINDVSIVGLARSLGISKAGFYWHFSNRRELLDELLKCWIHETTEIVTSNELIQRLSPRERLVKLAEMVHDYDLGRYELAIRQWAMTDKDARNAVRRADRIRFGFVRQAFADLGFSDQELEMRTMLFVGYQSGEDFFLQNFSRKRRRQHISRRVELLTSKYYRPRPAGLAFQMLNHALQVGGVIRVVRGLDAGAGWQFGHRLQQHFDVFSLLVAKLGEQ